MKKMIFLSLSLVGVVYMRADWSSFEGDVSRKIRSYERAYADTQKILAEGMFSRQGVPVPQFQKLQKRFVEAERLKMSSEQQVDPVKKLELLKRSLNVLRGN